MFGTFGTGFSGSSAEMVSIIRNQATTVTGVVVPPPAPRPDLSELARRVRTYFLNAAAPRHTGRSPWHRRGMR